jgi:hypothetical protein
MNEWILSLGLILRPTVSWPVCLWKKRPSEAYDQILITVKTVAGLLMWGTLSDERTGMSFTISAGPRQRSQFRVRVPSGNLSCYNLSANHAEVTSLNSGGIAFLTVSVFWTVRCRGYWLSVRQYYTAPIKTLVTKFYSCLCYLGNVFTELLPSYTCHNIFEATLHNLVTCPILARLYKFYLLSSV